MKNNFLKTTLLIAVHFLFVNQVQAQFGKLVNKVAEKTLGTPEGDAKKAITPDKKDLKALEEDAKDPFLEKQNFKKDGPSGIYYASVPLGITNITNGKVLALKKVYLEFDDANLKVNLYFIYYFK